MLTAVPTNSTIPVESAPGALTGLPQQQADSTDRSRKGQRKPKERGNSSSSESTLEREYTRWQENSDARDRSRSPQFLKKVCRLLDCLADVALEYARKVNTDDDSKALRKALKQRFSKKDVQTRFGTEAFLRGYKDKDSARHVIERNPKTINKALNN
ncbi:unnamed protein product [Mytilus coruscus]|uniref:Uncharacterized protein n=1 Tax=Mytilus coruscus TaxID=42192 RepID=A0A6J8C9K7_MYTCO|nr:unnamed protein product [Mytilus coruscus]